MKRALAFCAVLALALGSTAFAAELAGVKLPDTETVDGKTLKLNGLGLRKKAVVVKVYVLGLYLETPSKDIASILSSDQAKGVRLSFLRGVSGPTVSQTISEGFERNSKAQMPSLKARLEELSRMIPDVEEGDEVMLTYLPGKGTMVRAKGIDKGVIEGKDFADALLSVWLGAVPAQEDLKKALLGG